MPSLLKRPPCVTKYRLTPSGERITFCVSVGGCVALTRVASGTKIAVSGESKQKQMIERNTGGKHIGEELEKEQAEKHDRTIRPGIPYLVRLVAVFVFCLALEPVCPVHLLCLVISAIDEHACGIQPYSQLPLRSYQTSENRGY